ncbi:MAG: oligopeptide:H+ symporter [Salinimicrobium sediminis]|uniref:Proton-dependent oligopeptide transporter, POT family n=1 Tax=Salinimicrobium sediminis TaxID=1343891 RepID=A0A285X3P4_9FLAO|nr:peptide MFS transporter [Salinimicrobium sediminis]MDX1602480.1 oligopeptide:H+ symporter [Salinimicrobium sediminis]MDX1753202.1 oligopeptide:H+ symporter [Salinimicrobium sediminis]SOC79981.1 proton-dependent oligopeptide transporter, POT family [Salinimicrobium sediminis]
MAATVPAAEHDFFKSKVLGHPAGLFVLFFTEMWERFSFYGMRVLLINFLTMAIVGVDNPGWGWSAENAGALFGTYAGLLYLTPIAGGIIADKITGYRWAVVIGAAIMTLGHASMAIETEFSLYFGLGLLVIGTGFFKPNITSIISEMYDGKPDKKDGAYTIFYMGVNAGAFFGMMLCGYLAERVGWSWGFGLAGIFMLLGTLQFWLAKPLFGNIGGVPDKAKKAEEFKKEEASGIKDHGHNPFTLLDKILVLATSVIGFLYLINDPVSRIADLNLLPAVMPFDFQGEPFSGPLALALIGLVLFLVLVISRIARYAKVVRDRMIAVIIFAFFTVFFWMSFEQGATSLIIFARDSVDRVLVGGGATMFNIFNTLLTVIPLMIITWVLYLLWKQTYKQVLGSNIVLVICFGLIWAIVIWMLVREFQGDTTEITVSWFSILNSFFIIVFASFFSKWWESKYNPSAAWKYSFGLILLGLGFGLLAFGSSGVAEGAKVSMVWLILAYLFHTLGELCLSPLGLSYVSKLVPARMIAFMFGMWYLAIAIGNKLAGSFGGMINEITEQYSLSAFFLIFTVVPISAGIIVALLNPLLKKLMHGVK